MTERDEAREQGEPDEGSRLKRRTKRRTRRSKSVAHSGTGPGATRKRGSPIAFPKHSISRCLRIPQAVLEQNAGRECSDREAAKFAGIGWAGQIGVQISSALKFGLLDRPAPGMVRPTDLTRHIVRPQKPNDKRDAMREATLKAPVISDLYKHYRGENLPDDLTFLGNTAGDTFNVPADRVEDFVKVFIDTLTEAELLEDVGGKDESWTSLTCRPKSREPRRRRPTSTSERSARGVTVDSSETCFVMMPFAEPLGGYCDL